MVDRLSNPSMKDFVNRLNSFAQWPNNTAVKPKDLAESGFYYEVGVLNDDTVHCFCCGGTLNGWQVGDIPEERHLRLSGNRCEFLKSRNMDTFNSTSSWSSQQRNIPVRTMTSFDPIDNDMENELQRIRSFERNNGWPGAVDPRKLAAAGFYYTGIHDHVKCFACDVSLKAWLPGEDPFKEHWNAQPNCMFISQFANRFSISYETGPSHPNVVQTFRSVSHDPSTIVNRPLPASNLHRKPASKPNYASEHARLHTFINWPKECPVQPKELIDAGFYYTGNEDKVTCFKCGIILAGWEPQDTPWGEHVKWSKDCQLVIDHLRRRNPTSPVQGSKPPTFPQEQTWNSPPKPFDTPKSVGLTKMDDETKASNVVRLPSEQSECSKQGEQKKSAEAGSEEEEDEIFYLQKAVHKLIENKQYDYATINEAIQQRTKIEEKTIKNMAELLEAIQNYQKISTSANDPDGATPNVDDPNAPSTSDFSLSVDPEALHTQVKKMEDAHRCKICLDAEIGIVFLPCGHLVCCPNCAHEIQLKQDSICPICRRHIDSTIRTYLT